MYFRFGGVQFPEKKWPVLVPDDASMSDRQSTQTSPNNMKPKTYLELAVLFLLLATNAAFAQIDSLSTRTIVGTGDEVAVNVFVVSGSGSVTVVLRPSTTTGKVCRNRTLIDSGFAPSSDLEPALIATLAPGT